MKFLSFQKVHYNVNEEKRTVCCVITAVIHSRRVICFVGKANCSDEDKFNIELGKKIAFLRAKKQAYAEASNILKRMKAFAKKRLETYEMYEKRYKKERETDSDYLNILINSL